jgi:Flp pilus assembly protein TadG
MQAIRGIGDVETPPKINWRFFKVKSECGQSLVELALTFPVLIALLIGAMEFGRLAYATVELASAARAGAAYGIQNPVTFADTTGIAAAVTNDSPDISSFSPVTVSTFSCTCSDGTAVTCATAATLCVGTAHIIKTLQVKVTATISPSFHVPGLPTSYKLAGQSIMQAQE